MTRFDEFSRKMMHLAGQMGDNLRDAMPDTTPKWLQAGAAIGAARTGSKAVGGFVRRHPTALVATAVGAGVLFYLVRRHQKKINAEANAGDGVIEGQARRVEAKRAAPRKRVTRQAARNTADGTD